MRHIFITFIEALLSCKTDISTNNGGTRTERENTNHNKKIIYLMSLRSTSNLNKYTFIDAIYMNFLSFLNTFYFLRFSPE